MASPFIGIMTGKAFMRRSLLLKNFPLMVIEQLEKNIRMVPVKVLFWTEQSDVRVMDVAFFTITWLCVRRVISDVT